MLQAVFFDLDMIEPSLPQLHALFRARRPDLPMIVMTSAQDSRDPRVTAAGAEDLLLRKPVDPAVLARVLSKATRRNSRAGKA
jgi:FixJ family two-component response regulator